MTTAAAPSLAAPRMRPGIAVDWLCGDKGEGLFRCFVVRIKGDRVALEVNWLCCE